MNNEIKETPNLPDTMEKEKVDSRIDQRILDAVICEANVERKKKENLENRAGLIISVLLAIGIFLFNKINIWNIVTQSLSIRNLSLFQIVAITSGYSIFLFFFLTCYQIFKIIDITLHRAFDIDQINENLMNKSEIYRYYFLINTYKSIIEKFRENNDNKALRLSRAIKFLLIMLISIILYISIPLN